MTVAVHAQNKGEWSEFYAFLKLLSSGTLRILDSEDAVAKTVRVTKVRKAGKPFFVQPPNIYVMVPPVGSAKTKYRPIQGASELKNAVSQLLTHIQNCSGSFAHPESERTANYLGVSVKSDHTQSKGDLSVAFVRPDSGTETPEHEVSVKSWLGNDPTLFNASPMGTRLVFKVVNVSDAQLRLLSANKHQARSNLKAVFAAGGHLEFLRFGNLAFEKNLAALRAVDAIKFLVEQHFRKTVTSRTSMKWLCEQARPQDALPLRAAIRDFLRAAALGMTASREWNLDMSASDNYLIVDKTGELLFILGRNKLEDYLFDLAYVDSPDAERHDYGSIYKNDGQWEVALNFQVRLKRKKQDASTEDKAKRSTSTRKA